VSDSSLRIGWSVVRSRYAEAIPLATRRRRTRMAGAAAVVAGVALSVSQALWHWAVAPLPLVVLGLVLLAGAVGCAAATFVHTGRSAEASQMGTGLAARTPLGPAMDWRRQERIAAQLGRTPPPMAPEDRDLVIQTVDAQRDDVVRQFARMVFLPAFWLLAAVGSLATAVSVGNLTVLLLPIIYTVTQVGVSMAALVSLGRKERARERAMALPPSPPEPPRTWPRGDRPNGSQLRLPGE